MTRADLVSKLSLRLEISKSEADKYVLTFLDAIMTHLEKEGKVVVQGFGSFRVREYKPRLAKKPLTGEKYNLPVRRKPIFHAGKELKELINKMPRRIWSENVLERQAVVGV